MAHYKRQVQCELAGMVLHDAWPEKSFIELIDARFPYEDSSAPALVKQGWQISLNAAFCVLHELCRPPTSAAVGKDRLRELMAEWAGGPDHALKTPILSAAWRLIDGTVITWQEGVESMRQVGKYDGQRAALAIVYFASDCSSPDGDAALTRTFTQVEKEWAAKGI